MSATSNLGDDLMSNERRTQLRTDAQHTVKYDFYSYDGQKLGTGHGLTINISVGGMMLDTDKPLEPATKLLVEIVSPFYMFMATGHVVYNYQLGDRQFRLGVELEKVIQGGWQLLMQSETDSEADV